MRAIWAVLGVTLSVLGLLAVPVFIASVNLWQSEHAYERACGTWAAVGGCGMVLLAGGGLLLALRALGEPPPRALGDLPVGWVVGLTTGVGTVLLLLGSQAFECVWGVN